MTHRRFRAMNTDVELVTDGVSEETANDLCALADAEFARYEQIFSRFRPDSELSVLNEVGRLHPSPPMAEVVRLALAGRETTRGAFDPTVHDAVVAAGYDTSFEWLERTRAAAVPRARPACGGGVTIDDITGDIALDPGVRLDLGGIAKGYAADRVAELIGERAHCMVNAGGDVAVCGVPREGAWNIGVTRGDGTVMTLALVRGGLATSGSDRRRWRTGATEAHHLIDPATSAPSETDLIRATAVAASAAEAEVLAKRLFLAGRERAVQLADEHHVPAVLVDTAQATFLAGGLA
jgi:FAD:protein FMN transferase